MILKKRSSAISITNEDLRELTEQFEVVYAGISLLQPAFAVREIFIAGVFSEPGGLFRTSIITINKVDLQNIEKASDTPRQIIGNGPSAR